MHTQHPGEGEGRRMNLVFVTLTQKGIKPATLLPRSPCSQSGWITKSIRQRAVSWTGAALYSPFGICVWWCVRVPLCTPAPEPARVSLVSTWEWFCKHLPCRSHNKGEIEWTLWVVRDKGWHGYTHTQNCMYKTARTPARKHAHAHTACPSLFLYF